MTSLAAPGVLSPELTDHRPSLVDVLDRLLERGVVVVGDLRISVADVDLIFVGVKVFLAATDTMEAAEEAQSERAVAAWRAAFDAALAGHPPEGAPSATQTVGDAS